MYSNWDEKASLIQPCFWISITDLITYLHDLRQYLIFTPGKISETHLPILAENASPCAKNERFPTNVYYLCEGIKGWKEDLDLLQLAVSVMINKNKLDREYPFFKTAGEVEFFALNKINRLIGLLFSEQGSIIMNQDDFERFFDLIWEDSL